MIAVALAGLLLLPALLDLASRPTFRRLAFRNITRRRGEAALVILGGVLGTAIITASVVVGDTVNSAVLGSAATNLGPIDEVVNARNAAELQSASQSLGADPSSVGAHSVLPRRSIAATMVVGGESTAPDDRRGISNAELVEIDFDAARRLGRSQAESGFDGAGRTPAGDELVINELAARTLGLTVGDTTQAYVLGSPHPFVVRDVIPERGIAGYGTISRLGTPTPVFVAPGTIDRLAPPKNAQAASTAAAGQAPEAPPGSAVAVVHQLVIGNGDGVVPEKDRSAFVTRQIVARLSEAGIAKPDVSRVKENLLLNAQRAGDSITQLYRGAGFFSVAAGVLLLVNLFVMLAEERRSELGIMRAVGMRRNHLQRAFGLEGSIYSVVAAMLGGALGVGVGWAIARVSDAITSGSPNALDYPFTFKLTSLLGGMGLGLTISLLTVHGTSLAISRLNIIHAIRNITGAVARRRSPWVLAGCALGVVLGVGVTLQGIAGSKPAFAIAGPPLALFSVLGLTFRSPGRRLIAVLVCASILLWTGGVYSFLPEVMGSPNIDTFAVQGLIMVGAATVLATNGDRLWSRVSRAASGAGLGLAARLSLAYPVARRSRTGMLLGMFTSVIFTMTFLTQIGAVFSGQGPQIISDVRGGFDLYVDANPANPIAAEVLSAQPDVARVATLTRSLPRFTSKNESVPKNWALTGFDAALVEVGPPALSERSAGFTDDQAVYRAVLADPSLVIVSASFLRSGGGPPRDLVDPGDTVTVFNPAANAERSLTVVGVLGRDITFLGALAGAPFVRDVMGPASAPSRSYLKLRDGADPVVVATRLEADLVRNGVAAAGFQEEVERILAQNEGFFALLRGFLGLGLVIGIAGMGVVMVRAVRERRREIGMLRAMGFPAKTVRRAFLLEAAFIATQGILLGILLALLVSYQLLVHSTAFGDQPLPFQVPLGTLAVIAGLPLLAVLAATAAPAMQAARIKPAVALRIAD